MSADKEEYLRVYDEHHNFLGIEKRSVADENHLWHDQVGLWILDLENKRVLLQKRSPNKRFSPNMWGVTAGHVDADETIKQALYREVKEELGIDLKNYKIKKLITLARSRNYFSNYYHIIANIPLSEFTLQKDELSEVKYFDYEQLKNLYLQGEPIFTFSNDESFKKVLAKLDKIFYKKENILLKN